jgi:hypothetical protein
MIISRTQKNHSVICDRFRALFDLINNFYPLNKDLLKLPIFWGRIGLIYYFLKHNNSKELNRYIHLYNKT